MNKKATIIHFLIAAITVMTVKAEIALIDLRAPETKTIKVPTVLIAGMKKQRQMQVRRLLSPPTLSLTIPYPIPEYSGTYEVFGQNHLYYPNSGQILYDNVDQSTAIEEVAFYTWGTFPQKLLLKNNNVSLVFAKPDLSQTLQVDSLYRIDLEMDASSGSAFPAQVDTQNTAVLNYLTAQFGSTGLLDVQGSAAIACQSIWPSIDMVYTSNNTGLKIFYIVYPGGDYNNIVLHVNGSKSNAIVGNNLEIDANWDSMTLVKPKMYQYTLSGGVVTPVTICNASWQSLTGDKYKISNSSSYSTSLPLIVEVSQGPASGPDIPGVCRSTYLGGSAHEISYRTHADANNNLYVCGGTLSTNFPMATGGFQALNGGNVDGFITKFDASGLLKWSTYVGGDAFESIRDFDFRSNSILCVGITGSSNLPTTFKSGAFNDNTFGGGGVDGFLLNISVPSTGPISKDWLTYFGGNKEDDFFACKFDGSGNLFVVGAGSSTNLPPIGSGSMYKKNFNSAQLTQSSTYVLDCTVLKLDASLDTSWFTYYGTDSLGLYANSTSTDFFWGLDLSGTDLYACGKAGGTNLPASLNIKTNTGDYDGIITQFKTSGALVTARYVNNLSTNAIKLYNSGVYIAGQAGFAMSVNNSGNYYYNGTCSVGDQDACFGIYSSNLGTMYHQSFLGGSSTDVATDLQFGANGAFYIAGGTASSNFPVTSVNMYTAALAGGVDDFVAVFNYGNTSMFWSTCFGSPSNEGGGAYQASITLDAQNKLFLFGATSSVGTFPPDDGGGVPYFQGQNAGGNNGTDDCTITCFDLGPLNVLLGIEDPEKYQLSVGIYPNPVSSALIINHPELENGDLFYTIYDLSGKQLAKGQLKQSGQKTIPVSFLPPGLYVVNIQNGTRVFSNKFVKVEQ